MKPMNNHMVCDARSSLKAILSENNIPINDNLINAFALVTKVIKPKNPIAFLKRNSISISDAPDTLIPLETAIRLIRASKAICKSRIIMEENDYQNIFDSSTFQFNGYPFKPLITKQTLWLQLSEVICYFNDTNITLLINMSEILRTSTRPNDSRPIEYISIICFRNLLVSKGIPVTWIDDVIKGLDHLTDDVINRPEHPFPLEPNQTGFYIGQITDTLYKYGVSDDLPRRIKEHSRHFDRFDLVYSVTHRGARRIESLMRRVTEHHGVNVRYVNHRRRHAEVFRASVRPSDEHPVSYFIGLIESEIRDLDEPLNRHKADDLVKKDELILMLARIRHIDSFHLSNEK